MSKQNCNHISTQCKEQELSVCPQDSCEQEQIHEQPCPNNSRIKINGRVTFHSNGAENATVILIRKKRIVAKTKTDCHGRYEFICDRADYIMRAAKGNRRSPVKRVVCINGNEFEINFMLR